MDLIALFENFSREEFLGKVASAFGRGRGGCRWVEVPFDPPRLRVWWESESGEFSDSFDLHWSGVVAGLVKGDLSPNSGDKVLEELGSSREINRAEDSIRPILEKLLDKDVEEAS